MDYESRADLLVYKVKYESRAGNNDGKWFFVDYESRADKKNFSWIMKVGVILKYFL